jgi:hypothetical protein
MFVPVDNRVQRTHLTAWRPKVSGGRGTYDGGVIEHLADAAPEPDPSDLALTFGLLGGLCLLFVAAIVVVVVLVLKRRREERQ